MHKILGVAISFEIRIGFNEASDPGSREPTYVDPYGSEYWTNFVVTKSGIFT
jgi:hypothetical protein